MLAEDLLAPLLLELVLADLEETADDGLNQVQLGGRALGVLVERVLEHVVAVVALDHLVQELRLDEFLHDSFLQLYRGDVD